MAMDRLDTIRAEYEAKLKDVPAFDFTAGTDYMIEVLTLCLAENRKMTDEDRIPPDARNLPDHVLT